MRECLFACVYKDSNCAGPLHWFGVHDPSCGPIVMGNPARGYQLVCEIHEDIMREHYVLEEASGPEWTILEVMEA